MFLSLNDVYKLMIHTAYYLNKAGININFPPNFGNIVVPRASINAKIKSSVTDTAKNFLYDVFAAMNMTVVINCEYKEEDKENFMRILGDDDITINFHKW